MQEDRENLRISQQLFHSISDSAIDAIVLADSDGKIISCNPAARKLFGYDQAEILGQSLTILMPERYRNLHLEGIERFERTGSNHWLARI